jgi:hypothetical protein
MRSCIGAMTAGIGPVRPELAGVRAGAHFFFPPGRATTLLRVGRRNGEGKGATKLETHWIVVVLGQLAGLLAG